MKPTNIVLRSLFSIGRENTLTNLVEKLDSRIIHIEESSNFLLGWIDIYKIKGPIQM